MKKMITGYMRILLPLLLILGVVLAGCAQPAVQPAPSPAPTPGPAPAALPTPAPSAAAPSVKIIRPAAGATLPAGSIEVAVEVSDFEIVAPGGANAPGKGHLHYYLDVTIPTEAGRPAVSAAGTYKAAPSSTATWDNVAAGTHRLGVQLVNSDHTPLSPPVTAEATVTVAAPAPSAAAPGVKIIKPAAGATLPAGSIEVIVEVSNFEIVAPGGANAPGKGHLHYYLDVTIPTEAGKPAVSAAGTYKAAPSTTATWDNVAAGTHTLGVQLVNADHTPLSPPVTAEVTITVAAPAGPSVRIIRPLSGATITPGSIGVAVEVSNFEIVAPGGANAPGKGHLHYYLDVTIPTEAGKPAVSAAGTYKAAPSTTATWDNVAAGTHTLGVQLVNADHTPLSPPVTATVTITVGEAVGGGGAYGY